MGDLIVRAKELEKESEKKLGGWGFFYYKEPEYEEAAHLLHEAANCYTAAKCWDEAGATYIKLAECHLKTKLKHEFAANSYIYAAICYQSKQNIEKVIDSLEKAAELFEKGLETVPGNQCNQNAAKRYREIAERYESKQNSENAIEFYEKSAQLFEKAQLLMSANHCNHKAAQHAAQVQRYSKAIKIYEKIASHSLNDSLLKYQAKRYLLDAGICRLCRGDDLDSITKAIERYRKLDPTLSETSECQLLASVAPSFQKEDGAKLKILVSVVMGQASYTCTPKITDYTLVDAFCSSLPQNH
ncbi:alpha-soluble NSF attachment protein 2 [Rosa chinensis]|nr:alpha-soluble NSF attachment protein 2 [Rosa chinensis]